MENRLVTPAEAGVQRTRLKRINALLDAGSRLKACRDRFRQHDGIMATAAIFNKLLARLNMPTKLLELIHPGEILYEEFMRPLGISINGLARDIDVPPNRISEIINGKRTITADTALRLGKYFNVSPEIWLGLQADYDIRIARRTVWPDIEQRIRTRAA